MKQSHRALAVALLASLASLASAQERGAARDSVERVRARLVALRASLEEIRGEKLTREVRVEAAPVESADSSPSPSPSASPEGDDASPTPAPSTSTVGSGATPAERASRRQRALAKLGLVPRTRRHPRPNDSGPGSSEQAVARATEGQTLAWYEPASHTLFVVPHEAGLDASLDSTAIHELDHALEDERFDLAAYYQSARGSGPVATDEDALLARKIVAEGEATYVAQVWEATRKKRLDKLDDLLEKRAAQTRAERAHVLHEQAVALGDKGVLAAIQAEDALTLYLYRGLVDPYVQGPAIIARARKRGGWAAVDDLYQHPPLSTRELFHPGKRGVAREELTAPDPARALGNGFERTFETSLGEVGVVAFLEARAPSSRGAVAARLAASVVADRLGACENAARETCVAWLLSSETEESARELEIAAREAIREPGRSDGEPLVERRARRVVLVLGVDRVLARKVTESILGTKSR